MVPRGKARELSGHDAERPGFIEGDGEVGVLNWGWWIDDDIGDLDDNESRGDDWIDLKRITNVCQSAWQGEGDMEGGNIANP